MTSHPRALIQASFIKGRWKYLSTLCFYPLQCLLLVIFYHPPLLEILYPAASTIPLELLIQFSACLFCRIPVLDTIQDVISIKAFEKGISSLPT